VISVNEQEVDDPTIERCNNTIEGSSRPGIRFDVNYVNGLRREGAHNLGVSDNEIDPDE
jgi:hypothetical protein